MRNSEEKDTWFTSDPHYFHKNVIRYCERPFADLDEMHEALIQKWNKSAKPQDTVYVLGDVSFTGSSERLRSIMSRLNGTKILVRGNHDRSPQKMLNSGFDYVYEEVWMLIENKKVQLKHFPFLPNFWDLKVPLWKKLVFSAEDLIRHGKRFPRDKGQFLIHGHTHQNDRYRGRMIHVGVDGNGFGLVNLKEIASYIRKYKGK